VANNVGSGAKGSAMMITNSALVSHLKVSASTMT